LVDLAKFVQDIAPTSCVYLDDSYAQSLDSTVVKAIQDKSNAYALLDQTVFHPRSGGQPSDVGRIEGGGFRIDVKRAMLQSGRIVHFGKAEGKLGTGPVKCSIDWANRFLMMRRHTAAHLLDHCLATYTGSRVETTDSWLGEDPYVGYAGKITPEIDLRRLQEIGNHFIEEGLNVEIKTLMRADAEQLIGGAPNLARLPKTEQLRIVTIEGQTPIPCGGTHVKNIREIGALEVTRMELVELGFRLHFGVR
jgi:alanyl-tRNA synthetase